MGRPPEGSTSWSIFALKEVEPLGGRLPACGVAGRARLDNRLTGYAAAHGEALGVVGLVQTRNEYAGAHGVLPTLKVRVILQPPILADVDWNVARERLRVALPQLVSPMEEIRATLGSEVADRVVWLRVLSHRFSAEGGVVGDGFDVGVEFQAKTGGRGGNWWGQVYDPGARWTLCVETSGTYGK